MREIISIRRDDLCDMVAASVGGFISEWTQGDFYPSLDNAYLAITPENSDRIAGYAYKAGRILAAMDEGIDPNVAMARFCEPFYYGSDFVDLRNDEIKRRVKPDIRRVARILECAARACVDACDSNWQ